MHHLKHGSPLSPLILSLLLLASLAVSASAFTVTNTSDSGAGSFRQAILDANAAGSGTITFEFPAETPGCASGVCTITLTSGSLTINSNVVIDGPGASSLIVARSSAAGTPNFSVFSVSPGRTAEFSGLTITNGYAGPSGSGGGIWNDRSTVTVTNCTISGNTAVNGGAIANQGTTSGSNAILTVIDSTLSGNTATSTGGAIANLAVNNAAGTVRTTVLGSTLNGNRASFGGAIRNDQGAATLIVSNSTLSGNSGLGVNGTGGGAIFSYFAGQVTLANTTFADNRGSAAGTAVYHQGNPLPRIGNCIVAKAQGATVANFGGWGVTSDGYNISDDGSGPNNGTTDRINTDPKLQPLQQNGGPTLTHAPAPDSPAIDKGKNLATDGSTDDQRGRSRAFVYDSAIPDVPGGDESDIGAVEVRLPGTLALSADSNSVNEGAGNAPVSVTRTGGSEGPVTAKVTITNGTTNSSDHSIAGTVDPGFVPGTGINAPNEVVYAAALQPDGKVLIGGTFTAYNGVARSRIARANRDGSLDASFDPGTGTDAPVSAIVIQPDGKILIAGEFTTYGGVTRNRLARLNADGTLDTTFNPGIGANGIVTSMALQPDGLLVIAGDFTSYSGNVRNRIARIRGDGVIDGAGFNPGTGADGIVRAVTLQTDGRILIGGDFNNYNGTARARIARLNVAGSLDSSFVPEPLNSYVAAIALQPDGKILIGGAFTFPAVNIARHVGRLNANGSRDSSFLAGTNGEVFALAVQADGKILIGGAFNQYYNPDSIVNAAYLTRANTDGTRDTAFASTPGASSTVRAIALQNDERIVIGGSFTTYDGAHRSGVARVRGDLIVSWAADDAADKTAQLPIIDDAIYEGDQTLTFTLVPITGAASIGTPSTQTLTIVDNDPAPTMQFSAATYDRPENGASVTITVTKTGATEVPASVNYATSDGTATAGADYTSTSGTLNFSAAATSLIFQVTLANEAIYERDETINLALSSPSGATLGEQSTAVATITNDDPAPVLKLSADNYTFDESTGVATLTVTKTGLTALDATVHYSATSGTAIAGADFTDPAADLVLAPSETSKTFQIVLNNENVYELSESFTALLSAPVDATVGTPSAATVAITNDDPPPVVQFSLAGFSVNEGGTTATVTITKTGATEVDASVHYATSDGTATAGSDYTAVSGDVTFGPSETSKDVTIPISNDTTYEGDEAFNLTLSAPVHATLGAQTSTAVTIVENDPPPVIEFSSPTYEISESGPTVTITVVKSGETALSASVDYATADGSATAASDYTATSGTLTFAALEESKTFTVAISEEAFYEHSETFALVLSAPVNATLGANATAGVTITNNDPAPVVVFEASGYSVAENGTSATLRVTKTGPTEVEATVAYRTADGSATEPDDYPLTYETVTFGAAETFKDIQVAITDDETFEGNESFTVTLVDPADAQIGAQASTFVTIIENDPPPTIQFSSTSFSASEGAGVLTVTVTKTGSTALSAGIHYTTSDGSAVGSDYTATSGDLEFAPGETTKTFEVPMIDDSRYEGDESFAVTLTAPINATIGSPATATATITENDAPPTVQFSAPAYAVGEAGPVATITVTKEGATDVVATVQYETSDDSATEADYTATSGELSFAAGETSKTIEVPITDDTTYEGADEAFYITLSNATNAILGLDTLALVTIEENDPHEFLNGSFEFPGGNPEADVLLQNGSRYVTAWVANSPTPNSIVYETGFSRDFGAQDGAWVVSFGHNGTTGGTLTQTFITVPGQIYRVKYFVRAIQGGSDAQSMQVEAYNGATALGSVANPIPPEAETWNEGEPLTFTATSDSTTLVFRDTTAAGAGTGNWALDNVRLVAAPTIRFSSATVATSENVDQFGGRFARFTVSRDGDRSETSTVRYTTSDGSATAGSDYTAASSATFTMGPDESGGDILIPIIDDDVYENPETFTVTLSDPEFASLDEPTSATATIADNDAAPVITLSSSTYSASEAGGTVVVTVTKIGATQRDATVQYATADGTATQPGDYTLTSGTLTLLASETSKTIEIPLEDDSVYEGSENFGIVLSAPAAATLGTPKSALITITENDPAPVVQFASTSVSVEEEAGSVALTLTKSGATDVASTVRYETSNGSATAGVDYGATSGYVTFAAGETSKQVSVVILDDSAYEPDETFLVSLTAESDVTIGSASTATVTILVNDTAPEITVQQPSENDLIDGESTVTFGPVPPRDDISRTFTIKNDGTAALTGLNVAINGSAAADFSVTAQPAAIVAPGGSTVFTIKFAPSVAGTREAALHIASNDADENPFDVVLSGSSYTNLEAFRLQHFGSTANSGAGADTNDFDLDGLPNLLEFATGTNPTLGNGSPGTLILNGDVMEFTYVRTKAAVEDGLSFAVEWKNELMDVNWSSTGVTQQKMSETDTIELWKAIVPKGTGARRFLRLNIPMQP